MNTSPYQPLTEEQFYALPSDQQRIQIAMDCLAQIRIKKLQPSPMVCMSPVLDQESPEASYFNPGDLQSQLKPIETCYVCAKGGLLATKALLYDRYDMTSEQLQDYDEVVREGLYGIFEPLQLDMIENAFEMSMMNDNPFKYYGPRGDNTFVTNEYGEFEEESESEQKYNECYRQLEAARHTYGPRDGNIYDPTERLIAICNNIIDNGGEFVPCQP